jgi:ABC-type Na+ efflux pump permease subunit
VRGLRAVAAAEVRDIARSPLFWLGAAATTTAALVFGGSSPEDANGWVAYEAGARAGAQAATFFLLGLAAVSVAGERGRGTVRWTLPRPLSRAAFVLGKAAALALAALVLLVLCALAAWLAARPHGFTDARVDTGGFEFMEEMPAEPEFAASTLRARALQCTALLVPAFLTAAGLGLVVSCAARTSGAAVIVAVALAIPLEFLPAVLGLSRETARLLPFSAAEEFFARLADFGKAISSETWPRYGAGPLATALLASFGLPALAAFLFSRLDITD